MSATHCCAIWNAGLRTSIPNTCLFEASPLQTVCFRGRRLVRGETCSQTRQYRFSRQGCAPPASHGRHRDVAQWRALGSGRPRSPSPEHRRDRLLRQGGCRAAQPDCPAMAGGKCMIAAVASYLAVRRAVGFTLSNTEYLLRSFATFATDRNQTHIRTATAIHWASLAGSVRQRHAIAERAPFWSVPFARRLSAPIAT